MVNDFLFAGFCGLTLDLQAQREACLGSALLGMVGFVLALSGGAR